MVRAAGKSSATKRWCEPNKKKPSKSGSDKIARDLGPFKLPLLTPEETAKAKADAEWFAVAGGFGDVKGD